MEVRLRRVFRHMAERLRPPCRSGPRVRRLTFLDGERPQPTTSPRGGSVTWRNERRVDQAVEEPLVSEERRLAALSRKERECRPTPSAASVSTPRPPSRPDPGHRPRTLRRCRPPRRASRSARRPAAATGREPAAGRCWWRRQTAGSDHLDRVARRVLAPSHGEHLHRPRQVERLAVGVGEQDDAPGSGHVRYIVDRLPSVCNDMCRTIRPSASRLAPPARCLNLSGSRRKYHRVSASDWAVARRAQAAPSATVLEAGST